MWNPRLVIPLLVVLAIVGDLIVLALAGLMHDVVLPNWTLLAIALAYSQVALVAMWISWGRGPASLRFIAALGVVLLLAEFFLRDLLERNFVISPTWSTISHYNLQFTLFVLLGICLGESLVFQLFGWRLMQITDLDVDVETDLAPMKPQFSIGFLFLLTALVALVFGVARQVPGPWGPALRQAGKLTLMAFAAGAPVMALMWSLLTMREVGFRVMLAVGCVGGVFMIMVMLGGLLYHVPFDHSILVMIMIHLLLTSAALLAMRKCGFRLLRMYEEPKSRAAPLDD